MKSTKFKIYYLNGNETYVYAMTIYNAVIKGMFNAIERGEDKHIMYIEDLDNNKVYGDIDLKISIEEK